MPSKNPNNKDLFVIAVGSSAGGLEALMLLVSHTHQIAGNVCMIVCQHMSPEYKSRLAELLQKYTNWKVEEIHSRKKPLAHHIYIIPFNNHLIVEDGEMILQEYDNEKPVPSINRFMESLALDKRNRAIGVILSGTGDDGGKGMSAIRSHGGYTLVQIPEEASHSPMPKNIVRSGAYDKILPVDDILGEIDHYLKTFEIIDGVDFHGNTLDAAVSEKVLQGRIFKLLEKRTGTDFTKYKPSTLVRRLARRQEELNLKSHKSYLDYIIKHPKELDLLFETVLIGVTEFFRDKEAYKALEQYIAEIIENTSEDKSIRIWSVGTSTGEEAYSLAICIAEHLGDRLSEFDVQIFATDIDERALKIARKGSYPASVVGELSKKLLETYFIQHRTQYEVRKFIKQMVLFTRHDISVDPPFLKLDLIVCRNVLIYFDNDLQKEAITLFSYALKEEGFLFLGKSESVTSKEALFETLEKKLKIYRRAPGPHFSRSNLKQKIYKYDRVRDDKKKQDNPKPTLLELGQKSFFKLQPHPFVIINKQLEVVEINGSLRLFTELKSGSTSLNLMKMINSELALELRSILSKVEKSGVMETSNVVRFNIFETEHYAKLHAIPISTGDDRSVYHMVMFETVTETHLIMNGYLAKDISLSDNSEEYIRSLEHELAMTKEHLQLFTEELETTLENLQSVNEELQSANEELKSSNEEMETSNEELQSTNEELLTANQELRASNEELVNKEAELARSREEIAKSETMYRSLARNFPNGTINVVDKDWTLIFVDGQELADLGIEKSTLLGRNVRDFHKESEKPKFQKLIREAFSGKSGRVVLKYKQLVYEVNAIPLHYSKTGDVEEIMFTTVNITEQKKLEASIKKTSQKNEELLKREKEALKNITIQKNRLNHLFMTAPATIFILRGDNLRFDLINPTCKEKLGERAVIGSAFFEAFPHLKNSALGKGMRDVLASGATHNVENAPISFIDKSKKSNPAYFDYAIQPLMNSEDETVGVIFYGNDVTEKVMTKLRIEADAHRWEALINGLPVIAWTEDNKGKLKFVNDKWAHYIGINGHTEKSWSHFVHKDDQKEFKRIRDLHRKTLVPYQHELRLKSEATQAYHWHLITTTYIGDNGDVPAAWIGTAVNIDAQKETEFKKDEFLNIASHELRTPLTVIKGYNELLKDSLPTDVAQGMTYLQKSEKAIFRVNNLIDDLLSISRIQTGNLKMRFETDDLNALVKDVVEFYRAKGKNIELNGKAVKQVLLDHDRIVQVLENLVSNAIKFSPPDEKIDIHLNHLGPEVRVEITDYGIGIKPADQKRLFDRYYRVVHRANVEGMGLGLYISQEIMKLHGSELKVKSQIGKGSTFHFTLKYHE